jgi:hypothetical protein
MAGGSARGTANMYRQHENFLTLLKRKSQMPFLSVDEELAAALLLGGVRFSEGGINSPNAGPYGDAIRNELIPAAEDAFALVKNLSP